MPVIKIDGKEYEVEAGKNLIEVAADLGIFIPHYCYHPGLSISGNCRMCLIEMNNRGRMMSTIACNTFVSEGLEVYFESENVKKMRKGVMEFLLLNHPIDCPVCDQAGECKLQDFYMDYGQYDNRSDIPKVKKEKAIDVGPLVKLDQERCIMCSRCVRFCSEISESHELALINRGERTCIDTFPGVELDNPYSVNVVDICPVGALTSKDFRFQKRVWFMKTTNSVCMGCAKGCNVYMDYEDSKVYRYRPRHNPDVNQYWMCDEGRLSYKNLHENRLNEAFMQGKAVDAHVAKHAIKTLLNETDSAAIAALASPFTSLEDNFALTDLLSESSSIWGVNQVPEGEADQLLRVADKTPNQGSLNLLNLSNDLKALEKQLSTGQITCLIILENQLNDSLLKLIEKHVEHIIYLGSHHSKIVEMANFVLPITTHSEHSATYINSESLLQKVELAFPPSSEAEPAWYVLGQLYNHDYNNIEILWNNLKKRFDWLSDQSFYLFPEMGIKLPELVNA